MWSGCSQVSFWESGDIPFVGALRDLLGCPRGSEIDLVAGTLRLRHCCATFLSLSGTGIRLAVPGEVGR